MLFFKSLRSHHVRALFELHNFLPSGSTNAHVMLSNSYESSLVSSIFRRTTSLSAQFEHKIDTELINAEDDRGKSNKVKKRLDVLFKEAVGLSENLEQSESEHEGDSETVELKKNLKKLEVEVRTLNQNKVRIGEEIETSKKQNMKVDDGGSNDKSKGRSLSALFLNKPDDQERKRIEEPIVYKELAPNMVEFAGYLYEQGYFRDANFLPRNKFDATCFENNYGRDFLKFAAEKFGRDNQQIAIWLSGRELKKVALFGCPSLSRKTVFSAKTLRTFFKIQEDTVCSRCVLKQSCKFVNQSVWKVNNKNLDLAVVMRVIILYALETVPTQLIVPDEIKNSVTRLLEEVQKLSQTI